MCVRFRLRWGFEFEPTPPHRRGAAQEHRGQETHVDTERSMDQGSGAEAWND